MKSPCIAVDVSKGKSVLQAYLDPQTAFSKTIEIQHDQSGFKEILALKEAMDKVSGQRAVVVFEATGIYHRGLSCFLSEHDIETIMVNPLQAAKFRKQELRTKKTDKRDCRNIAGVYFANDLRSCEKTESVYAPLRQLNREYESEITQLQVAKIHFIEELDIVYPNFERIFQELCGPVVIAFIKRYPHPKSLNRSTISSMTKFLHKVSSHRELLCQAKAQLIRDYAKECASGCMIDDIHVDLLQQKTNHLEYCQNRCDKTLSRLIEFASPLPSFPLLLSIPGIGENLAARILAEIGDISRFPSASKLIAYAGLDPIVYQSGKNDGQHLHISKKGNKRLRTLLYLGASCSLRKQSSPNCIRDFHQKKTHQLSPMNSKAASTACAAKLCRVIYGLCRTGTLYQYFA